MKTMPRLDVCHHLGRASIFLLVAALIAGIVGCDATSRYTLTMAVTPSGSGTAIDLTGASPYAAGTVVTIRAEANEGYLFVRWRWTAGRFFQWSHWRWPQTILEMPDQDVMVTAIFVSSAIRTWYDLDAIRDKLDGSYILMNDLDSSTAGYEELAGPTAYWGQGWFPIGDSLQRFTGNLDGQGHQIRDLFINRPGDGSVGLFGVIDAGVDIVDLAVVNITAVGTSCVGGLAGSSTGNIRGSYVEGSITGEDCCIGGLVGCNYGTVNDCNSAGSVTGVLAVGGLVGNNYGTISNSYSTGSVTGDYYVGGLAGGCSYANVINSFWDIETSGQATSCCGIGMNTTQMKDIATFSGAGWNITAVGDSYVRNPAYIWNIVNGLTYPFLSWQPVS